MNNSKEHIISLISIRYSFMITKLWENSTRNAVHFFKRILPQALHKVSFVPVTGSVFTLGEGWCRDLFEVFRSLFGLQTYGDLHKSQEKGVPEKNQKSAVIIPIHSPKLHNDSSCFNKYITLSFGLFTRLISFCDSNLGKKSLSSD